VIQNGAFVTAHCHTKNSIKVSEFLTKEHWRKFPRDTKVGGATLTKLLVLVLGYAPGAAVLLPWLQLLPCRSRKKIVSMFCLFGREVRFK